MIVRAKRTDLEAGRDRGQSQNSEEVLRNKMGGRGKPGCLPDDAQLLQLAQMHRSEIARRLGRTLGSVETRASKIGIRMISSAPSAGAKGVPRLRKYFEALPYGKRTGRVAYVIDPSTMPKPSTGAEWAEEKSFNAANKI